MDGFPMALGFEEFSYWLFLFIGNANGSQGIEGLAIMLFVKELKGFIHIKAQSPLPPA
jgi:hypothetical protein